MFWGQPHGGWPVHAYHNSLAARPNTMVPLTRCSIEWMATVQTEYAVRDLNVDPTLPYEDNSFDVITNAGGWAECWLRAGLPLAYGGA